MFGIANQRRANEALEIMTILCSDKINNFHISHHQNKRAWKYPIEIEMCYLTFCIFKLSMSTNGLSGNKKDIVNKSINKWGQLILKTYGFSEGFSKDTNNINNVKGILDVRLNVYSHFIDKVLQNPYKINSTLYRRFLALSKNHYDIRAEVGIQANYRQEFIQNDAVFSVESSQESKDIILIESNKNLDTIINIEGVRAREELIRNYVASLFITFLEYKKNYNLS